MHPFVEFWYNTTGYGMSQASLGTSLKALALGPILPKLCQYGLYHSCVIIYNYWYNTADDILIKCKNLQKLPTLRGNDSFTNLQYWSLDFCRQPPYKTPESHKQLRNSNLNLKSPKALTIKDHSSRATYIIRLLPMNCIVAVESNSRNFTFWDFTGETKLYIIFIYWILVTISQILSKKLLMKTNFVENMQIHVIMKFTMFWCKKISPHRSFCSMCY